MLVEPLDVARTVRRWTCAHALGISLLVISAGDWFPDDHEQAHLREHFLAIDITPDAGLAQRLVDAVRAASSSSLPLDGIYTTRHHWLVSAAEAAKALGLPTSPTVAYRIACDKYLTRSLESQHGGGFVLVTGVEDLATQRQALASLAYPLVVKPVSGVGSGCVFKVHDHDPGALVLAVAKAAALRGSSNVLIEPYVDGPKFDANFVLCDGQVLFSEVSDDFPRRRILSTTTTSSLRILVRRGW